MEKSRKPINLYMPIAEELYERIVAAKIFIDENYHEPINLDEISQKAFLSRFHFHRLFTQVYKKTPHQYLTTKRIEKAKDLLSENKQVTEVCNEVGFESLGSFSVLFKKEIGFAPTYYRNMAWLKKQQAKEQPKRFIPHCFIDGYRLDKSNNQ
jgi:AraC-like DNA-binding protein